MRHIYVGIVLNKNWGKLPSKIKSHNYFVQDRD